MPSIDGPFKIIDQVSSDFMTSAKKIDRQRQKNYPVIPVQIHGIQDATVIFWASCSSEQEIKDGSALWSPISGGEFTEDVAIGLFVPFPYIKVEIANYISGTISIFMDI